MCVRYYLINLYCVRTVYYSDSQRLVIVGVFFSLFRKFPGLVRYLQYLNLKVRAFRVIFLAAGRIQMVVVVVYLQLNTNLNHIQTTWSTSRIYGITIKSICQCRRDATTQLQEKVFLCNAISSNIYADLKFTAVSRGER